MTINNKQGSILLMCFYVISSLSIVGAAFGLLMVNESLSARHSLQNVQAMYVAQAGLAKAVDDLSQYYQSTAQIPLFADQYCMQNASWNVCNSGGVVSALTANIYYVLYSPVSLGTGKYTVQIMNDGVAVNKLWFKSTGMVGQVQKTIQAYIIVSNPIGPVMTRTAWQVVNN